MRILAMLKLSTHPEYCELFNKLTDKDMELMTKFVTDHQHLDKESYMVSANKWLLDMSDNKNCSSIQLIITKSEEYL